MKALLFVAIHIAAFFGSVDTPEGPAMPTVALQVPQYYTVGELEGSLAAVLDGCSVWEDASKTCTIASYTLPDGRSVDGK